MRIPLIVALLAIQGIAAGQQPDRISFGAASIKPSDPGNPRGSIGYWDGGRFGATNASIASLIGFAYDVRAHQITGGPAWTNSAMFDVEGKPDSSTVVPADEAPMVRQMVQSLLADRCKLSVHREMREEQIYELVVTRGGSRMKDSTAHRGVQGRRGQITGDGSTMAVLSNVLSGELGRSVIDKTGLAGRYDFVLRWTPDPDAAGSPSDVPSGPSLFTAIQEDLGLRLQSTRGLVEMIVIDRVEKPDAN